MKRKEYKGHHLNQLYIAMILGQQETVNKLVRDTLDPGSNAEISEELGFDYAADVFGKDYKTNPGAIIRFRQEISKVYSDFLAASDLNEVVLMANRMDGFCYACPGLKLHCETVDVARRRVDYKAIRTYYNHCLKHPETVSHH